MNRTLGTASLAIASLVVAVASIGHAQGPASLTRHVPEAVANGQAASVGQLPAGQSMRLVLVLPLRDQQALDDFLRDLYDPASPSYRHFLTVDEFTARFGPTQADYDSVIRFAQASGFTVVGTSPNRLNVDVTGTVSAIQSAFHLTMRNYQHPTEGRTFFAPDREPTPDLGVALWRIAGLDNYSLPHAAVHHKAQTVHAATTGSGPSASFLGSDMRAAYYGSGPYTGLGQSLGLLEFYGTDLADLNTYYTNVGQTNTVPVTLVSTDGTSTSCVAPSCDDTEQTLDMTQALGMAPGLSSLVMYVGSSDAAIFNAMATASPLNAQLSSSWTWSPADPSVDQPYFQEFAAQGQSLFQAAGDSGKWGFRSKIYPADSAYVTSVGGTDLVTSGAGGAWSSETTWVDGGGGISPDGFAIPAWQTSVAASCASCSKSVRNGPDVSANANFTFYVCADQTACTANEYGGTSFAAPMWAGYMALVNDAANEGGPGPGLGFINPTLYGIGAGGSYSTDFHDITSGSNGYSATAGFDLATGWGSPNGSGLLNTLITPGFSLSASPASVSVGQGQSGSSTITSAVTNGYNSTISLSANAPSGVTVGFTPASITGAGSATFAITVAATAPVGTYAITVSGTDGSTTETTTVSLTVTGTPPSFTLSASPASISVARNGSAATTITSAVAGGFNSAISLSDSGEPGGVNISFSPPSLSGAGTSTMTVQANNRARAGTYTITVTGKGGGLTKTTTVKLTVVN